MRELLVARLSTWGASGKIAHPSWLLQRPSSSSWLRSLISLDSVLGRRVHALKFAFLLSRYLFLLEKCAFLPLLFFSLRCSQREVSENQSLQSQTVLLLPSFLLELPGNEGPTPWKGRNSREVESWEVRAETAQASSCCIESLEAVPASWFFVSRQCIDCLYVSVWLRLQCTTWCLLEYGLPGWSKAPWTSSTRASTQAYLWDFQVTPCGNYGSRERGIGQGFA